MLLAAILMTALPAQADAKRGKGHKPHQSSKKAVKAPNADPDKDGLNNRYEKLVGTNRRKADTDGNGVTDGREDYDGDGVDNRTEQLAKTDPRRAAKKAKGTPSDADADPDRDGLSNRGESEAGLDPRDPDTDDDDILDGDEHAGRIAAASDESVTIALFGGGTLVARYDARETDVICKVDESDEGEPPPEDPSDDDDEDADDDLFGAGDLIEDTTNGNGEEDAPAQCPPPAVGDTVYEADVDEEDPRGPLFVMLDLVGV